PTNPSSVSTRVITVERCVILYPLPWYVRPSGTRIGIASIERIVNRRTAAASETVIAPQADSVSLLVSVPDGQLSAVGARCQRRHSAGRTAWLMSRTSSRIGKTSAEALEHVDAAAGLPDAE